ncbi:MAG: hypothetical protein JXA37_07815 [Chloroflexia bacterium]|nr:hypothetical protein [Chloroflexia bacterium]
MIHLFPFLLFDIPAGLMIFLAFGAGVVVFAGLVLLEALVLRLLQWGSVWISLLDSFLVNLATTILGFFLASGLSLMGGLILSFTGSFLRDLLILLFLGAMSVGIEGVLLLLIRRQPALKTWKAALITNVVSYVGLFILITLLGSRWA